ncbi:MAG: c-type cytochrome [Pirellulaceae bacterium]
MLSANEGPRLFRQLQCNQCHAVQGHSLEAESGSNLDLQKPFVQPDWIVDSLQATHFDRFGATMQLRMTAQSAEWFAERFGRSSPASDIQNGQALADSSSDAGSENIAAGQALFERVGCLACHHVGSLGRSSATGGRALTDVAKKRSNDFFAVWLRAPETIHPHHQMPVFPLSEQEIADLATYLSSLETPANSDRRVAPASEASQSVDQANVVAPEVLAGRSCQQCHTSDSFADADRPTRTMLSARSRWDQSCIRQQDTTGPPWQPRYVVSDSQRTALQDFISAANVNATSPDEAQDADSIATAGQELFETIGCLNCHARNDTSGLSSVLVDSPLAENPDVPLAALLPPSLNRIGDKLTDDALRTAITRTPVADHDDSSASTLRPWLHVRMPRFRMNGTGADGLLHYLISLDRKDATDLPQVADNVTETAVLVAGQRLVSSAGFGCVSCHIIGDSSPTNAPVNALGPDLTGLAQRIRPSWFYEWVHDPAKLVPRIEMPAIQRPVAGVLQDDLDQQLAAVWQTLNMDNLTLPPIDPVRTVRRSGQAADERSVVLTDVIRLDDGSTNAVRLVKPFLIGLPNRHNVLFDLETAQLSHWTAGDTAYQRTEGKTWFWTLAGTPVWNAATDQPDLQMRLPGGLWLSAVKDGQFVTEPDAWRHANGGVELDYRLLFRTDERTDVVVRITQSFVPIGSKTQSGFRRSLRIDGLPIDVTVRWRIVDQVPLGTALQKLTPTRFRLTHRWHDVDSIIDVVSPQGTVGFDDSAGIFAVDVAKNNQTMQLNADYKIDLTLDSFAPEADRFPLSASVAGSSASRLDVVPGFAGRRMWLPVSLMPTGIAWRPNGDMVVSSLKGRIWTLRDLNADGEYDVLIPSSDDLPACRTVYMQIRNTWTLSPNLAWSVCTMSIRTAKRNGRKWWRRAGATRPTIMTGRWVCCEMAMPIGWHFLVSKINERPRPRSTEVTWCVWFQPTTIRIVSSKSNRSLPDIAFRWACAESIRRHFCDRQSRQLQSV